MLLAAAGQIRGITDRHTRHLLTHDTLDAHIDLRAAHQFLGGTKRGNNILGRSWASFDLHSWRVIA